MNGILNRFEKLSFLSLFFLFKSSKKSLLPRFKKPALTVIFCAGLILYNFWLNKCSECFFKSFIRSLYLSRFFQGSTVRVLEVGCGVGNTSLPLLQWDEHHRMFLYSCDYSDVAIRVLKQHENYDPSRIRGFVWDITQEPPEDAPTKGSLDFVVCIYVLSSIQPSKTRQAINNLVGLLKPGGMLLLKDYGRFDLTQLRFKKDRYIDENLYCRGDGTLVYFFARDELDELLRSAGLVKKANFVDKRLIVNRAKQVKMYRQWLQAKYQKPQ